MQTLLELLLAAYTVGILLPLWVRRMPQIQGILGMSALVSQVGIVNFSRIGLIFYL